MTYGASIRAPSRSDPMEERVRGVLGGREERLAETRASTRKLHGETLGAIRAAPLEKRRRRGPGPTRVRWCIGPRRCRRLASTARASAGDGADALGAASPKTREPSAERGIVRGRVRRTRPSDARHRSARRDGGARAARIGYRVRDQATPRARGEVRANLGLGPRARGVVRGGGNVFIVLAENLDEVHATHEVVVVRLHRGVGSDGTRARACNARVGTRIRSTRRSSSRRVRWRGNGWRSIGADK